MERTKKEQLEQLARLRQEKVYFEEEEKMFADLEAEQKLEAAKEVDEVVKGRNWGLGQRYERLRDCAQVGPVDPRKVIEVYGFKPSLDFQRGVKDLFAEIEEGKL